MYIKCLVGAPPPPKKIKKIKIIATKKVLGHPSSLFLLKHAAKFFKVDFSRFVMIKFCESILDLFLRHVGTNFPEFGFAQEAVSVLVDGLEGQGHLGVVADELFVAHGSVGVNVLVPKHFNQLGPVEP